MLVDGVVCSSMSAGEATTHGSDLFAREARFHAGASAAGPAVAAAAASVAAAAAVGAAGPGVATVADAVASAVVAVAAAVAATSVVAAVAVAADVAVAATVGVAAVVSVAAVAAAAGAERAERAEAKVCLKASVAKPRCGGRFVMRIICLRNLACARSRCARRSAALFLRFVGCSCSWSLCMD